MIKNYKQSSTFGERKLLNESKNCELFTNYTRNYEHFRSSKHYQLKQFGQFDMIPSIIRSYLLSSL
jgi:hypothetical protein